MPDILDDRAYTNTRSRSEGPDLFLTVDAYQMLAPNATTTLPLHLAARYEGWAGLRSGTIKSAIAWDPLSGRELETPPPASPGFRSLAEHGGRRSAPAFGHAQRPVGRLRTTRALKHHSHVRSLRGGAGALMISTFYRRSAREARLTTHCPSRSSLQSLAAWSRPACEAAPIPIWASQWPPPAPAKRGRQIMLYFAGQHRPKKYPTRKRIARIVER